MTATLPFKTDLKVVRVKTVYELPQFNIIFQRLFSMSMIHKDLHSYRIITPDMSQHVKMFFPSNLGLS